MTATAVVCTRSTPRRRGPLALLFSALAGFALLAVVTGPVTPDPLAFVADLPELFTAPARPDYWPILIQIRLPRVALAVLAGAALAAADAAMQGLFRNPLADPGLIGVSSGAALGAVAVLVLGDDVPAVATLRQSGMALPVAAAFGGLAATALVYRLGSHRNRPDVATLVLAGIAINILAGAGTGLLTYLADDSELRDLTFWLMGSLASASWERVVAIAPFVLASLAILRLLAQPLNTLLLGEDVAFHLGYPVARVKAAVMICVAGGVGAVVAVTGIIGFVGLVVPHLLRLTWGADHRLLLPGAALLGGALLLAADTVARTLIAPQELPIGIITSLIGGPFFLYLLTRRR